MFTGLVREIGTLVSRRDAGGVTRLEVRAPRSAPALGVGDSLAVNGICLTATAVRGERVHLDAVAETRRVTTLDDWRPGRRLHLEPALRAGDALDGHLVQGHVDAVGVLRRAARADGQLRLTFAAPDLPDAWLLPKGSVAVDGVSLTLDAAPSAAGFTVSLIPHTLQWSVFGDLRPGDRVNVEGDVLAKGAAARAAAAAGPSLTVPDILARGFRRAGRRR